MSDVAHRQLLFGILAMQMDFISREELVAATSKWLTDKSRPLEEILVELGALSEADRQLLAPLVERHVENHGGDPERSLAALSSMDDVRNSLAALGNPALETTLQAWSRGSARQQRSAAAEDEGPATITVARRSDESIRFRALRPHAKGGLGEVWVAEDTELGREVALKEIQQHLADEPDHRNRFLLEAEITGGLEHPGIVPVYGLGRYPDGRPYYAMRFIRGDSLRDAAQSFHRAEKPFDSIEFRNLLGRFVDVCNAIGYAHSRGVLHRDLKPGNIMLGKYGETLVVDWGLARLTGEADRSSSNEETTLKPRLSGGSSATRMGSTIGTPAYMPPEQAAGKLDELGPRSDVYSLGATLYFLLTGKPPVEGNGVGEVLRKVERGEIGSPRAEREDVPRVLAAICLKAMARRPEARYATPGELGEEIERFLADEPVAAYNEPLAARVRRWVRKHPTASSTTAAVVLVSLIGLGLLSAIVGGKNRELAAANGVIEAKNTELAASNKRLADANDELKRLNESERRAREEEQRSKENALAVLDFFQNQVLSRARPKDQEGGLGRDVTLRAAIAAAEPNIENSFEDHPLVEASIRNVIGLSYLYLGDYKRAIAHHARARKLHEAHLGLDHPDTLASMNNLALAYKFAGRLDDAIKLHDQTLKLEEGKLGPDHLETLTSMSNLAEAYRSTGRFAEAINLHERTLDLIKAKLGPDHPKTLVAMNNLALAYQSGGRLDEAIKLHEETLKLQKEKLGPEHPETLLSRNNLAEAYRSTGRFAEATKLHEQTLDLIKAKLGPDHPQTFVSMNNLALAYQSGGRLDEAITLYEQTLELMKTKLGPDHPQTFVSMNNLALAYESAGRLDEAIKLLEQTLKLRRKKLGPEHPDTITSMATLAIPYGHVRRLDEAIKLHEQTLELRRKKLGPDHPDTLTSMNNLALAYESADRLDEAIKLHEETLKLMKANLGPDHPDTLTSMNNLALAYESADRLDEAIKLHEETLKLKKAKLGPDHPTTLTSMNDLAGAYYSAGRLDEAIKLHEETLKLQKEKLGPDHPHTLTSMGNLAAAYWRTKQLDHSIPLFEKTLAIREKKLGRKHPDTQLTVANLGVNYRDAGRLEEAIPLLEEAYGYRQRYPSLRWVGSPLLSAYLKAGKRAEAAALIKEQLRSARRNLEPGSEELGSLLAVTGNRLLELESYTEAEPVLRECLEIRRKLAEGVWTTYNAEALLGAALAGKAEALLRESKAERPEATDSADKPGEAARARAEKLFTEAERLMLSGYAGLKKTEESIPEGGKGSVEAARRRLVRLYTTWNKPKEAAKWRKEPESLDSGKESKEESKKESGNRSRD